MVPSLHEKLAHLRSRLIAYSALSIALSVAAAIIPPAKAQNSVAAFDKCTCRLNDQAQPDNDGARATNATLCVQTLIPQKRWCEVTILCLRGGIGPGCIDRDELPEKLTELIDLHYKLIAETASPAASFILERSKGDRANFVKVTDVSKIALERCAQAFEWQQATLEELTPTALCGVDGSTSWFYMDFQFDDHIVTIQMAPAE